MAFKTLNTYNEEKNKDFFLLPNNGDSADVIFLYKNVNDVLIGDMHYIKSADYTGYVHCCGKGCPACAKGIRTQTKLFIPLYNIAKDKIEFWDRSNKFEPQLINDVLKNYPEPANYVFKIIRHGDAGSVDTTYEIKAIARNSVKSYTQILAEKNAVMPDYYERAVRAVDIPIMDSWLNTASPAPTSDYAGYTPVPRGAAPSVTPPQYGEGATELPDLPADDFLSNNELPEMSAVEGIETEAMPDDNAVGDIADTLDDVKF